MFNTKFVVMNQQIAKYGAYIGGAMIGIALLLKLLKVSDDAIIYNATYIAMIFGLFMSLKHYRDTELNGFISFTNALKTGAAITFLFSLLFAVYQYLILKMDPASMQVIIDQTYQELYDQGNSEEEIEAYMQLSERFMTPGFFGFASFFGNAIYGIIFTLIMSFFVKRENPNPFDEIETDD